MARDTVFDHVSTISQAITKVVALFSLIIIIWIDAQRADFDAKDIELILSGFVAGAEALSAYKKIKK